MFTCFCFWSVCLYSQFSSNWFYNLPHETPSFLKTSIRFIKRISCKGLTEIFRQRISEVITFNFSVLLFHDDSYNIVN